MTITQRILCVDDDINLLSALERRLRGRYEIVTAIDGLEGLRKLSEEGPFAVIVSDQHMPGMDGITFLGHARTMAPITVQIMLTICDQTQTMLSAINQAHVFHYIGKPFAPGALEAALDAALEHYTLACRERILVDRLNAANARLEDANTAITAARDEAVAANRSKSEFLANISHEIRTPMTAILGYTDLLSTNELSEKERAQGLRTIRANGEYLLEIINDILDLAKMEAGMLNVERISCSPARILSEVVSLMRVKAHAKNIELTAEFAPPIPDKIRTDPLRLRQILINLVGNAVKFTRQGHISVTARLLEAESIEPLIEFEVADTGIGMTPETVARLFKPYTQADDKIASEFGGTGLGLMISRQLAQKLGGDITATSARGQGSIFRASVRTGQLLGTRMWNRLSEVLLAETVNPVVSRQPEPFSLANAHVLLAEDGIDNQRLISFMISRAGAHVIVAENGKLAVEQAMQRNAGHNPFDLILMDLQMPVMDGCQATRALREQGYSGKIIALTAHAMAEDRIRCMNAGCDGVLTKPVDRNLLINTLCDAIGASGEGHEIRPDEAVVMCAR